MTTAVGAKASQARTRSILDGGAGFIDASQLRVRSVYNFPSVETRVTQSRIRSIVKSGPTIEASQLRVRVIIHGRVADPRVRAWEFTLDGHDYYVLRLGETETLVYDTHSEEWYVWGSGISNLWKLGDGANWLGGTGFAATYGSNVVVGDDGSGVLYFLNPDGDTDDDAFDGDSTPHTFERIIQGQIVNKGYDVESCYGVELLGSIGALTNESLTSIKLEYSDDRGSTYIDAGTVDVLNLDYNARVDWRSLGSMSAPGRLFKITDYGALKRVDSLTMVN